MPIDLMCFSTDPDFVVEEDRLQAELETTYDILSWSSLSLSLCVCVCVCVCVCLLFFLFLSLSICL